MPRDHQIDVRLIDVPRVTDAVRAATAEIKRLRRGDVQWRVAWKWEQQVRMRYEAMLIERGVDPAELRAIRSDALDFARATFDAHDDVTTTP